MDHQKQQPPPGAGGGGDAPEFILDVFADPRSVRDIVRAILHTIFFNRFFPAVHPSTRQVLDLTLPYVDDDELATMIEQRAAALERHLDAQRSSSCPGDAAANAANAANANANANNANNAAAAAIRIAPTPPLPPSSCSSEEEEEDEEEEEEQEEDKCPPPPPPQPASSSSPLVFAQSSSSSSSAAAAAAAAAASSSASGARGQICVQFFEKRRQKTWLSRGDEEVCWESWTVKVTVAEPRTEFERCKVRRAMEQTLLTTAMKIVTLANAHKDHIPPITTQGAGNPFPCKISIDEKPSTSWASRMRIF